MTVYTNRQFKKIQKDGNTNTPPEPSEACGKCCVVCLTDICPIVFCISLLWQRGQLAQRFGFKDPDFGLNCCCTFFCWCCTLAQDASAAKKYAFMVDAPIRAQVQQPWNPAWNHGDQGYDPYGNGYQQQGGQQQW